MKLSKKQLKVFRRIHKKHPVSMEFLKYNYHNIIKELKYYAKLHFIIKCKLIQKNNRTFMHYNVPRILSKNYTKKYHKNKNYKSMIKTWSKNIVMYNKRLHLLDKIKEQTNEISNSDSQNDIDFHLTPDEIQKQLKAQLELLKGGKRCQPSTSSTNLTTSTSIGTTQPKIFPSNSDITKRLSLDRLSSFGGGGGGGGSSCSSFDISLKDAKEAGPSNIKQSRIHDDLSDSSSSSVDQFNDFINRSLTHDKNSTTVLLNNNENNSYLDDIEPIKKQQKSFNFIDSLINKINNTIDKNPNEKNSTEIEKVEEKKVEKLEKTKSLDHTEEDSLSSGEFLGFPDVDIIQSNIPGMLPTPVVPRKLAGSQSAFISEDLDKFMRDNLLDKKTNNIIDEIPKLKRFEDGLVCKGAIPPQLKMAALPTELGKPRTVAEKRIMLQKNKNIKYLMIENENTIYHELKKRSRDCSANIPLIKSLQKQSIPATRDFWKATSWLLTQNGKFYFQIANVDGIECKLIGGYGNNLNKNLPHQFSCPIKKDLKRLTCSKNCKDLHTFKNIKVRFNLNKENHKIHLVPNVKDVNANNYKPGPLSSKCLQLSYIPNYGSPEIYHMPKIQLEVFPKINRPLDDICKSYLKMILPSKSITKEWAEFAVSTLIQPKPLTVNLKESTNNLNNNEKSFTFNIPYLNDQENILVRRIYNRKERFDKITTNDLQFRKIANKSNDPITLECANILSEMIDSVAIGLSEDSLIKNDPDIDYNNKIEENTNLKIAEKNTNNSNSNGNIEKKPDKKSNKKSGNPKSRLMSELKRLNATIIDAGGSIFDEEVKEQCTKPYCRLGCVCMSLSGQSSLKKHCKKPECMIECNCAAGLVDTDNINSSITSQDALMLRQKATARLARMEREFSSTVVLTNTETLLINESQYERKRRCTKRYKFDSENDQNNLKDDSQPPNKRLRSSTQKEKGPVTEAKLPPLNDLVYVNEDTMKILKHCEVNLCKLQYFENIEKWCMLHCLYKCFCKAKELSGKPFVLKKNELSGKDDIVYSRKAKYSFDKNEETTRIATTSQSLLNNNKKLITDDKKIFEKSKVPLTSPADKNKPLIVEKPLIVDLKRNEELLKEKILFRSYFEICNESCRRILPIPKTYRLRNRRYSITKTRSTKYRNFIENTKTRLLLNERILNSEFYRPIRPIYIAKSSNLNVKTPESHALQTFNKNKSNSSISDNNNNEKESQFLKISSVISLNPSPKATTTQNVSEFTPLISTKTDLLQTPPTDLNNILQNRNFDTQDIHKNVLKLLNGLVTRTMHNICKIQSEESKNIPNPVDETLHISQWRYFLQAYIEGIIHIWEVKVDNKIYFTGTMQNIMPFIRNAISVVNIKAIRKEDLPLFGKMLNAKIINQQTNSLSILMAGHNDYWRILGMTNSSIDYLTKGGVIKPTPQSHPWLAKKINILYEIMAKNRIDRIISKQQNNTNNNNINGDNNNDKNISINADNNNDKDINKDNNEIIKASPLNVSEQIGRLMKMNIKIRQLTQRELIQDKFTIPISSSSQTTNYRWLVLDIVDDFSHIIFGHRMECLSHNKIKIAFQRSYQENKMVRLAKVGGPNIDCYVMKNDKDRIYLGPFDLYGNPQIILYQNIDGKMMLREDFEKLHNIKRTVNTTGFWLCRKNGKILFDVDTKQKSIINLKNDTIVQQLNLENNDNSNQHQQNLTTFDEPIVIDNDTDGTDGNSNEFINNLTTNLQINNVQTLNKDNKALKAIERTNSSDNNKLATTTTATSTNNSQILQPISINSKISNYNFMAQSPLPTTNSLILNNSNNIVSKDNFKSNLNNTEINSNQIKESGLIALNPGVYEIKCTNNTNEAKTVITTNNNNFRTINESDSNKSLPLYKPQIVKPVIPLINNRNDNKLLLNNINLLSKSEGVVKIVENLNNLMVAKKSTTSAALNPNTLLYRNVSIPFISKTPDSLKTSTPHSLKTSKSKLFNILMSDSSKLPSSTATTTSESKIISGSSVYSSAHKPEINQSKGKKIHQIDSIEIYQSKKMKSFDITSNEIIPTDNAAPPVNTKKKLEMKSFINKIPSFIKISPMSNTSTKSNINSMKTTATTPTFSSNTITTSSISSSQDSNINNSHTSSISNSPSSSVSKAHTSSISNSPTSSKTQKEISKKLIDINSSTLNRNTNNFGIKNLQNDKNCTKYIVTTKTVADTSRTNINKNNNLINKTDNSSKNDNSPKNDNSSKNDTSTKNNNSRPRTIAGYFISNIREYPRFGGMRREPNYLIKSSSNSAIQLPNLDEVAKFLNNHVRRHCAAFKSQYKNVCWNFVAYKKSKFSSQKEKTKTNQNPTSNDVNTGTSSKKTVNFGNGKETVKNSRENNKTDVKETAVVNDIIVIDDED